MKSAPPIGRRPSASSHVLDELCGELTFLRQAARIDGTAPIGRHRKTHDGGRRALLRADLHHADGGRGGRRRGGNPASP